MEFLNFITVKKFSRFFLLVTMFAFASACVKNPGESTAPDQETPSGEESPFVSTEYQASEEIFPNPERGFYAASGIREANGNGISESSISIARRQGRTLYLLEFYLTNYVTTDIAEDYLQTIRTYFQSLRDGGAKCILRFCYSDGFDESDKPWDATPEQVMRHLEQVTPILQEYYDVIMVVQAGFVGSWGEWYYTENFKDNASRKALVDALLAAVPQDRQIQLRTPAYKMGLYGYTLADTITRAESHKPTAKARLAGHNDCYLSSANDVGTFRSNKDREYWEAETKYTIMGGESCELAQFCHCQGTDKYRGALKDLALNHFTYLNNGYHQKVLSRWREENCLDEIKKRLGYRFVLEQGQFTKEPEAGKPLQVILKLRNVGFAAAMNPRDVELVLTDKSGKVLGTWPVDSDPRYWMPEEEITINQTIMLPEGISGDMVLYLNLPDPCETLHNNPYFSIRIANEGVWNEETGYNQIHSFSL